MDMNCLLIRDGAGNVVLVETGAGPKLTERAKENFGLDGPPRLLDELALRGVRPDEVTLVVNTHLHFDHAGGNTVSRRRQDRCDVPPSFVRVPTPRVDRRERAQRAHARVVLLG
jgi:glyoxylase-like metal-dependent hydrolase (beta-lactamase superfamily II)